jgi:hypothetical protein
MKDLGLTWPCAWRIFIKKWVNKRQNDFDIWFEQLLRLIEAQPACPLQGLRGVYNRKRVQGKLSFPASWAAVPAECPNI